MNCPKCNGTGTYYTQPFTGAWKVNPCSCKQSMQEGQAQEQRLKNILKKWDEFANGVVR